ncbi:MAG: hypothetical protein EPN39_01865 [Chitinophagaceae bacterium]|nr:MAG: hypothetical protein EPN39_01865 [Chitinophagaceae bacterium]
MKKLKFFAAGLALVFAFCSAFTTRKSATFDSKYQTVNPDGSYYILGVNVTGETPGPTTYNCQSDPSANCTAELNSSDIVTRNGHQEVLISETGNHVTGDFQNNQ